MASTGGSSGTSVSRSLKEINDDIKTIRQTISETTATARNLQNSLAIRTDTLTGSVKMVQSLKTQLSLTQTEAGLLREKMATLRAEGVSETSRQMSSLQKALDKTTASAAKLEGELKRTVNQGLDQISESARKATKAIAGIVAGIGAIATYSIQTGDALSDLSTKFGIPVEQIQLMRNQFDKITGDASGFDSALASVQSVLGQVAKGSSRTKTALALLGLELDDLNGQTAGEAFETIMAALRAMPDEAERAAAAQALLGDTGYEMALVAGQSEEYLAGLNEQMEQAGLITQDEADAAGQAADAWSYLTQAFQKAAVSLAPTLLPLIQQLTQLLTKLMPIITSILNVILSIPTPVLAVIGVFAGIMAVIPGLVAAFTALNAAMWANPAVLMFAGVALGGLLLAGTLAAIIGAVSGTSSAGNAAEETLTATSKVVGANEVVGGSTTTTTTSNVDQSETTNNITIEVTEPSDLEDVLSAINAKRYQVGA